MKIKKSIALLSVSSCLAFSAAHAGNQPQDPRSLAMGGTGTAVANSAQAHFYNPSLLVSAKENEDFNFEIQTAARAADPTNLRVGIENFIDNDYASALNDSLNAFNTTLVGAMTNEDKILALPALINDLTTAASALQTGIQDVSGRALTINGNFGVMTSVPNGKIGWAVYANAWTDIGLQINLGANDNQLLTEFIALPTAALESLKNGTPIAEITSPTDNLDSSITFDAVLVTEVGFSIAAPTTVNNYSFDIGITPKFMQIQTFGSEQKLGSLQSEDMTKSKDYSSFNVDIGASKQLNEYWKSGLTIKNLIPQSFKTPSTSGSEIKISPAVRAGTSYQYGWATVAADIDLTKNTSPASGLESQYLSLGAELDVWLAKLRLGYRANLAKENNNTTSAGLGLYLFGLNIDAAVAAGQSTSGVNDISASLQIGLQW